MNYSAADKTCYLICTWLILQFCQLVYVISSWTSVRAAFLTPDGSDSDSLSDQQKCEDTASLHSKRVKAFSLFWITMLSIILTYIGSKVIHNLRTKFSLGFFTGLAFTMTSWTLTFAVESGDLLFRKRHHTESIQGNEEDRLTLLERAYIETNALFAILTCLLYFLFMVMLFAWQDEIVDISRLERKALLEQERAEAMILSSEASQSNASTNGRRFAAVSISTHNSSPGESVVQS